MNKKILSFLIPFCLLSTVLKSQQASDSLFNPNILHEIRLEFEPNDFWDILLKNYNDNTDYKSGKLKPPVLKNKEALMEYLKNMEASASKNEIPYLEANATIDGNQLAHIGVRLKGFSSFFSVMGYKKSLKLDFNAFIDTLNYKGLKKINLNNGVGDPSMQRDFISYYMLRKSGIVVPRLSFAKVYLNDRYWGVYEIVEQVDKTFLENHFASGKGDLYKTMGWNLLDYTSGNFIDYNGVVELKTNEETSDGSSYINFVKSIHDLSSDEFSDSIQKLFYTDYYFKVLALDIISKNWDSYIGYGRNFYLYQEPVSGLFYWIPWDYNLSWDGNLDFSTEISDTCANDYSFLMDTIADTLNYTLNINGSHMVYLAVNYGDDNFDEFFDFGNGDTILSIKKSHAYNRKGIYPVNINGSYDDGCYFNKLEKAIMMDTSQLECSSILNMNTAYYPDDKRYDSIFKKDNFCCNCRWDNICQNNFSNNLTGVIDDPAYQIDYITSGQVLIEKLFANKSLKNRYLDIFKYMLDSIFNVQEINQLITKNTDLIRSAVYSDTNFLFSGTDFENDINAICEKNSTVTSLNRLLKFRKNGLNIEYSSLNHNAQRIEIPVSYNQIVINEFLASSSDNADITSDWIELYNNTNHIVPLKKVGLSDNEDEPGKFLFPDNMAIKPKGFVLVWADKKNKKNGLHADFKLDADGENIILSYQDTTNLDKITYLYQVADSTTGRYPDGTGNFMRLFPTPGKPNSSVYINIAETGKIFDLTVYPNPATTELSVLKTEFLPPCRVSIYNIYGHLLFSEQVYDSQIQLGLFDFSDGIYSLVITDKKNIYRTEFVVER